MNIGKDFLSMFCGFCLLKWRPNPSKVASTMSAMFFIDFGWHYAITRVMGTLEDGGGRS